jgi:predicted nucleotidyltransferase
VLVLLFGSVARGDTWAESDIDLAVAGKEIHAAELSERLGAALGGVRVDVVPLSADVPVALLAEILRDGVCLYEGREGAHAHWRAAALWQVETDGPLLRKAGRAFLDRVAERGLP